MFILTAEPLLVTGYVLNVVILQLSLIIVLIDLFCAERLDYDFQNNSCDEDKMCGHYTQVTNTQTHTHTYSIHS